MLITYMYKQHTTAVNTYILNYNNKGNRNTGTCIYPQIINSEYQAGG